MRANSATRSPVAGRGIMEAASQASPARHSGRILAGKRDPCCQLPCISTQLLDFGTASGGRISLPGPDSARAMPSCCHSACKNMRLECWTNVPLDFGLGDQAHRRCAAGCTPAGPTSDCASTTREGFCMGILPRCRVIPASSRQMKFTLAPCMAMSRPLGSGTPRRWSVIRS